MSSRNEKRLHRKRRIKASAFGTSKKPRISVFRSLNAMYVQFIDDSKGKTIIAEDNRKEAGKKFDVASCEELGKSIAKKAAKKGIKEAVFDRGGYRYHGKIKSLADGIREGGIKI